MMMNKYAAHSWVAFLFPFLYIVGKFNVMSKFIVCSSPNTKAKLRVNIDQILYIERKIVQEGYNREMTKIVFNNNETLFVEDKMDRLDKQLSLE